MLTEAVSSQSSNFGYKVTVDVARPPTVRSRMFVFSLNQPSFDAVTLRVDLVYALTTHSDLGTLRPEQLIVVNATRYRSGAPAAAAPFELSAAAPTSYSGECNMITLAFLEYDVAFPFANASGMTGMLNAVQFIIVMSAFSNQASSCGSQALSHNTSSRNNRTPRSTLT